MKNIILLITSIILFLSLIITPVFVKPNYEVDKIEQHGQEKLLFNLDYVIFSWSIVIDNNKNPELDIEDLLHYLSDKNIIRNVVITLIGVSLFYTLVYIILFNLFYFLFRKVKYLKNYT